MRFLSLSLCALFIFFATPVWAEGQAKNPEIVDYDFDHETEMGQNLKTAKHKTEPSEAPLSQPVKKNTTAAEPLHTAQPAHTAESTHAATPASTAEPLHSAQPAHTAESTHAATPASTAEPLHSAQPAHTAESTHAATPASTTEPLHSAQPAHTAESTHAATPATTAGPLHSAQPAHTTEPPHAAKTEKTSAHASSNAEADLKKGQVIDGVLTIIDEPAPDKSTEEDLLDSLFAPAMEAQQEVNLTPHQTEPTTKVPAKEGEAKVELAENAPPHTKATVARKIETRTTKSVSAEYQFWAMSSKNWNYNIKRYYTANQSLTPNRPLYALDKVGFPSGQVLSVKNAQLSPQATKSYSSEGRVLEISKFPRLR